MPQIIIRQAEQSDCEQLAALRTALWPESPIEEHARELELILAGHAPGILPLIEFVAEGADGKLFGFLEAALRSCADGCDRVLPVGYVEGWYVAESHRRQGIGTMLLEAAENWARTQGCAEMASDCIIDNLTSKRAHAALGFEIASTTVNFRKKL